MTEIPEGKKPEEIVKKFLNEDKIEESPFRRIINDILIKNSKLKSDRSKFIKIPPINTPELTNELIGFDKFTENLGVLPEPQFSGLNFSSTRIQELIDDFNSRAPRPARLSISQAREVVERNSSIADYSILQREFLEQSDMATFAIALGISVEELNRRVIQENQARVLYPIFALIDTLPDSSVLKGIVTDESYKLERALEMGLTVEELSNREPSGINGFDQIQDLTRQTLELILKDTDSRREYLGIVDAVVNESTNQNIRLIGEAEKSGFVVKKDLVIVGGGPLTAIATAILGPYFNITVITEQDRIGEPWRNRPLYINSSTEVTDQLSAQLPLLGGSTTPVSPAGYANQISIDGLLDNTALVATCEDGRKRRYIAGQRLGASTAAVIASNADDFIVGHTVLLDRTTKTRDLDTRLTLLDKQTGVERQIDASTTLFLGGPGKEKCIFDDPDSRIAYETCRFSVRFQIKAAKELVKAGRINEVKITLPRILTLTDIEDLTSLWQNELQRRSDLFPMQELFRQGLEVDIAGPKDTGRVVREYLDGIAPPESYPQDIEFNGNLPNVTIYNEPAQTASEYEEKNRRRYARVFSPENSIRTKTVDSKVKSFKVEEDLLGTPEGVELRCVDKSGKVDRSPRTCDYLFVSTGFEKIDISSLISNLGLSKLVDSQGNIVGRGNSIGDYVGGSFDGLTINDAPAGLREIVTQLQIPENTISLWVTACKLQRELYTLLCIEKLNRAKIIDLATKQIL